ncbi:MAG TPA: aldehyde dehydrogenase family protein, partial [Gemmatimonadales bacterium]
MSSATQNRTEIYIGGHWVRPVTGAAIDLVDPSTEEVFARGPLADDAAVDAAVSAARKAFDTGPWPRMSRKERMDLLFGMGEFLDARAEEYGDVVLQETGALLPLARSGVKAVTGHARYLASVYENYPWEERRTGVSGVNAVVVREPIGVVAALVPWN